MQSHKIQVAKTAHYYTLGKPGPEIRFWVICCHGYGQLARNFIRKFDVLTAQHDTFVLAPEGLSRFYWQGMGGDAGASWMTKEDRLEEIADYSAYLSVLYQQYLGQLPPDVRIVLFAFSQGCATVARWAMRALPVFHDLVLWGGALPEDLSYKDRPAYWVDKSIYVAWGNADPFITPERLTQQREILKAHGLQANEFPFEGAHTVDRAALKALFETFIRQD